MQDQIIKIVLLFSSLFQLTLGVKAQTQLGVIKGSITDAATEESVVGATVSIVGTTRGSVSDGTGTFTFSGIPVGQYTLQVTYVGYVETRVEEVIVKDRSETLLEIHLEESGELMEEVVITKARSKGSDIALLAERQRSSMVVQKIGVQELSRRGVSDAASAVTKMSGISKQDGSNQVYVRGLGDRYNSTSLNGLPLPSNDPERKNIALDIFSTDIVEFISVDKVYNSKMSGDFAGGNVDIYSKNYSGSGLLEISLSSTVNTNALSHADNFLLHPGPNKLGYSPYSIPQNPLGGFNFQHSVNPVSRNPYPGSLQVLSGKSFDVGAESRLNFFGTLGFTNGFEYREGINRNVSAQGANLLSLDQERFGYNTNTTGLFNAGYVLNTKHRLSYNFMFVNTSSQTNDWYRGFIRDLAENDNGLIQRGTYQQNKLFVNQLLGAHVLSDRVDLDWGVSATKITSEMPDRIQNKLRYIDAEGGYTLAQNTTTDNHRYNQRLDEYEYAINVGGTYKLGSVDNPQGFIKIGYNGRFKNRDFEAIQFNFRVTGTQLSTVVDPDNLDAFFNQINYNNGYFRIESFAGETPQTYQGEQQTHAGYTSLEYSLTDRLTSVIGLRYENLEQSVSWRTQLDPVGRNNTFSRNEFLPNLNLKYELNEKQNLRLGASRTYTLPQFKERALFVYEDVTEIKTGNPDLYPSDDYNLDIKWELFPKPSELISLAAFGKYIKNPINETTVASSTNDISFINTGNVGTVVGVELELRKDIFSMSNDRDVLSAGFNAAYMKTSQDLNPEKVAHETRYKINLTDTRSSFTGASDLLVNGDVTYTKRWNNEGNVMATVAYSYFSDKIYSLGVEGKGNFVDRGVGILDLIVRSKINRKVGIDFMAKNILDPTYRRIQENAGGHVPVLTYKRGRFFTLGVNYQF